MSQATTGERVSELTLMHLPSAWTSLTAAASRAVLLAACTCTSTVMFWAIVHPTWIPAYLLRIHYILESSCLASLPSSRSQSTSDRFLIDHKSVLWELWHWPRGILLKAIKKNLPFTESFCITTKNPFILKPDYQYCTTEDNVLSSHQNNAVSIE